MVSIDIPLPHINVGCFLSKLIRNAHYEHKSMWSTLTGGEGGCGYLILSRFGNVSQEFCTRLSEIHYLSVIRNKWHWWNDFCLIRAGHKGACYGWSIGCLHCSLLFFLHLCIFTLLLTYAAHWRNQGISYMTGFGE